MKHLEKEDWRLTLWRFPKIIDNHNEPVNLLLLEALKIRKPKPEINSREEWAELIDLLFLQHFIYFLLRPFVLTISTAFTFLPLSCLIVCWTPIT